MTGRRCVEYLAEVSTNVLRESNDSGTTVGIECCLARPRLAQEFHCRSGDQEIEADECGALRL